MPSTKPIKRSTASSNAGDSKQESREDKKRKAAEASARAKAWAEARKAKRAAKSSGDVTASASSSPSTTTTRTSRTPSRTVRSKKASSSVSVSSARKATKRKVEYDSSDDEEEIQRVKAPVTHARKRRRVSRTDASSVSSSTKSSKVSATSAKSSSRRNSVVPKVPMEESQDLHSKTKVSRRKSVMRKVIEEKAEEGEELVESKPAAVVKQVQSQKAPLEQLRETSMESKVDMASPSSMSTASSQPAPVPAPVPQPTTVPPAAAPTPKPPAPTTTYMYPPNPYSSPNPTTPATNAYYPHPPIPYGYTVLPPQQPQPNGNMVFSPPPHVNGALLQVPPPATLNVPTTESINGTKIATEKVETESIQKVDDTPMEPKVEPAVDTKHVTWMQRLKSPGCWAFGIFVFSTTLGISILSNLPTPTAPAHVQLTTDSPSVTLEKRCFANAGIDALDSQPQVLCENPSPCPPHGRCAMGQLVDCKLHANASGSTSEEPFLTPSSNGDGCILSKGAIQDLVKVHETLINLTCDTTCAGYLGLWTSCALPSSLVYKGEDESDIQFDLAGVAHLLEMSEEHVLTLVQHMEEGSNILIKDLTKGEESEDRNKISIGLTPEFVQMELPVSFPCWARIVMWDLFQSIVYLMIGIVKFTSYLAWSIASAHPLFTLAAIFVLSIVNWIQNRRHSVIQRREFVIEIQNVAYDKLVMDIDDGGEGYASLHLRDEICHEMYPRRGKDRDVFLADIWPRVTQAVRTDNRVTKSRKAVGGKSLEWWEWVSGASKNSRKSKISSKKED